MTEQSEQPVVGIVMGSDSDWPVMREAAKALQEFGIPFEADVVSAHRMPDEMIAYGQAAAGRGLRVVIAGAGGAAHLPGMLASVTPLPVVWVPVPLKYLDGMDSLLSIVQMPAGVPVATVSIGGARNAGLLAARIVGSGSYDLATRVRERMVGFQSELRDQAHGKGAALREQVAQGLADCRSPGSPGRRVCGRSAGDGGDPHRSTQTIRQAIRQAQRARRPARLSRSPRQRRRPAGSAGTRSSGTCP